jgi:N-acetyl-gamma-glutamyl-phosphate reductase
MTSNKTKIFIDGQHGTTGLQILDRLKDRADIELLELPMADRKDLGKRAEIAKASDITVLCLPDAAAKELVAAMGNSDTVVIDASTAHRVADGWTYGFPELAKDQRQKLLASNRISNPGCYPTGAIALLRPLVDAGIVRADSTPAVFGVSGYTGGGKELIAVHEQPGVEPFGLYGLELTHKHVPEMKKYSGLKHAPLFVPSVGHYAQGMLITVPITRDITTTQVTAKDVHQVLTDYYAGETFVPVRPLADRAWLERDRFLRGRPADRQQHDGACGLRQRCRRQRAGRGLARQSRQGRVGRGGAMHQPSRPASTCCAARAGSPLTTALLRPPLARHADGLRP